MSRGIAPALGVDGEVGDGGDQAVAALEGEDAVGVRPAGGEGAVGAGEQGGLAAAEGEDAPDGPQLGDGEVVGGGGVRERGEVGPALIEVEGTPARTLRARLAGQSRISESGDAGSERARTQDGARGVN